MKVQEVTLAIPCYNASDTISDTLNAVFQLDPAPREIICINDGSTDNTAEIIRQFDSVELMEHDSNQGLANTRNTALTESETEYLAMIDADIQPRPEWLGELRNEMQRAPAAVIAGRVIEMVSTRADRWRSTHLSQDNGSESYTDAPVVGANALYHRSKIKKVDGWDPKYRTNYEDFDLCERLLDAGLNIRYVPTATVEHHRTDTTETILNTVWNYQFKIIDQPDSWLDFPRRIARHTKETGLDLKRDLETRNYRLIPITLRRPIFHLQRDVEAIRDSDGPWN